MYLLVAKRILHYLQGTRDFGLFYNKDEKLDLFGFADNNYTCGQKEYFGLCFNVGRRGRFVVFSSWLYL